MPTFAELVEADRIPPVPVRPKGLFETLLGARPEAMYIDAFEHPEKYTDETKLLLDDLMNGRKAFEKLSLDEQVILDHATIDFASAPPKKAPPILVKKAEVEEENDDEEDVEAMEPVELGSGSEGELRPYWWLG